VDRKVTDAESQIEMRSRPMSKCFWLNRNRNEGTRSRVANILRENKVKRLSRNGEVLLSGSQGYGEGERGRNTKSQWRTRSRIEDTKSQWRTRSKVAKILRETRSQY